MVAKVTNSTVTAMVFPLNRNRVSPIIIIKVQMTAPSSPWLPKRLPLPLLGQTGAMLMQSVHTE